MFACRPIVLKTFTRSFLFIFHHTGNSSDYFFFRTVCTFKKDVASKISSSKVLYTHKVFVFHFNFRFQFTCFAKCTMHNFWVLESNSYCPYGKLNDTMKSAGNFAPSLHLVHFHCNYIAIFCFSFLQTAALSSWALYHMHLSFILIFSSCFHGLGCLLFQLHHYLLGLKFSFILLEITIIYHP